MKTITKINKVVSTISYYTLMMAVSFNHRGKINQVSLQVNGMSLEFNEWREESDESFDAFEETESDGFHAGEKKSEKNCGEKKNYGDAAGKNWDIAWKESH